jgi:alpha-1,4-digalacturonate transport system permease protein
MEFPRYVIAEIEQLTDINSHNEARIMLALFLESEGFRVNDYLDSLEQILRSQHQLGHMPQTLIDWNWISEPIQWLIDPSWTMFWSIFVYTWAHTGFYMLILLAGLQSIPRDLYEAAQMDGTSESRVFWRITLPLLMPILLVVTVLSLIKAVQAFEELYALQVGWISLVSYIVENAGIRGQKTFFGLGIAAMASLIVASILIVLSLLQFYLTRRQVKL